MVLFFKGMVLPGRLQATCVSGAPPGPNRVLQGQQKQNQAQEKSPERAMANTSTVALGTKPGAIKQDIPRGAANVGASISYIHGVHTPVLHMKSQNKRL